MSRASRIAATIRTDGRNNWQQRPAMSEATRNHIHGRLEPMDWQDGDMARTGAFICALSAVSVILAIAWVVSEWMA